MAGCNKVAKCNDRPLDALGLCFGANNTSAVHARVRVVIVRIPGAGYSRLWQANARALS